MPGLGTNWRSEIVERVRARDPALSLPTYLDWVIGLFFPELAEPLAKWRNRLALSQVSPIEVADAAISEPTTVVELQSSGSAFGEIFPSVPEPRWAIGALSTDRTKQVKAMRDLYRDGAYRFYAPRIDYDRVLAEARDARSRQESLSALLARWSKDYVLGRDLKPILAVLRAAGLVA